VITTRKRALSLSMRSQASAAEILNRRVDREQERLALALLLSLLFHTLLLSLIFGGQGLGLPGFGFPWRDRRIEVPDVRVALVPTHVGAAESAITPVAEPLQQASIEQPVASGPAPTPSVSPAPAVRGEAVTIPPAAKITAGAKSKRNAVARAPPVKAPTRADRFDHVAPAKIPEPAVVDAARSDTSAPVVRAAPSVPTPVIAVPPSASSPESVTSAFQDAGDVAREAARLAAAELEAQRQEVEPQEEAARVEAARREAERQEAAQRAAAQEAQRQEVARQEEAARVETARREAESQEAAQRAAAQEAQRQEVARQEETARVESARREAERQEAARLAAAQQEAQRQEVARQEAARQEAARQEAARQEAARQEAAQREAARRDAARQEAERQEAARVEAQEAAARREAALRAIGRQLDEEAARRQAATASADPSRSLPPPWTLRRYRLLGRTDPNQDIILYAEAWERKIQLNMTFDMVREAVKQPHTDPMVKVAIRSDGSVESVTFVVSSGVAAIDDAIQRVIDSQKPYRVFPPSLAREYDVIEIRRTWYFDMAIRLH
jgi:TolA protein